MLQGYKTFGMSKVIFLFLLKISASFNIIFGVKLRLSIVQFIKGKKVFVINLTFSVARHECHTAFQVWMK